MSTLLGARELEAAILGGVLLSSGGSGLASSARHRALGEDALARGSVRLVPLAWFADGDAIAVSTAVGAPGAANARTVPQDAVDAAQMLAQASGKRLAGVMPGHVPGLYAWTIAAALGIPLADAATNGRAHPTQKMGGMGLASRPDIALWQAGSASGEPPLKVLVNGDLTKTSNVMRSASVQNGGLLNAVRGPFDASFVRAHGAPRAISFAMGLGDAILGANGAARIAAAVRFLTGQVLVEGEVIENSVRYESGFDIGTLTVSGGGRTISLGVYNEFMTADESGVRLSTFPDFLGSLDPASGEPVAISALKVGTRVAIVSAGRASLPLGSGVRDPAVYPEVEAAMGVALARYALAAR